MTLSLPASPRHISARCPAYCKNGRLIGVGRQLVLAGRYEAIDRGPRRQRPAAIERVTRNAGSWPESTT